MSLCSIKEEWCQDGNLLTPAFVYREPTIMRAANTIARVATDAGCQPLFAVKSFSIADAFEKIVPPLAGFAVSSLFEARLIREVTRGRVLIHITTPVYRSDEIEVLSKLCDCVTLNSLSQWENFRSFLKGRVQCALRVNPQLSFVEEERYNPCRKHSKLGMPLESLKTLLKNNPTRLHEFDGLHFHTNCDSSDFSHLLATMKHLDTHIPDFLHQVEWVNLGGGYIFNGEQNMDAFYESVYLLRSKYDVAVFIEPGASVVREAGYLVSTILDVFESEEKIVAVLDTTVNHWPEVFEYQFEPDVAGHVDGGRYEYILAGSSCLAGDIFGEYSFEEPLEIGSRVIFANAGAYSLVKAHMFNGINLPTIYALTESGELIMKKRFTYADFADRCGVERHAAI